MFKVCASRSTESVGSLFHRLQANYGWAAGNIFAKRPWRTLKYECVYLLTPGTGSETVPAIRKWMTLYDRPTIA